MAASPVTIGRFEVIETIGQGGMGTLLLAHDPMLDRRVAIKLLKEDDDELRERFAREARSAARLHHANIVTIFDVGEHEGRPFIAMEYVEGQTLARIIKDRQPLPTPRRLQLIEDLCDGLAYAHKAGIIHRDVKPANVMVDNEGSVKILDFGIARAKEASRLTRAGMLVGTLNYMSPEQVTGSAVDHRSDIFAVGLVLYEVLAYQKAFPGKALSDVLDRIVKGEPEPLSQVRRGIDPEVIRIVQRAIEKDPARRYDNLRAMAKDLQAVRMRLDMANEPTQPFRVGDLQPDSGTRTSPTPTPSGASRERQEEALRRAREIADHLKTAGDALAKRDYAAAIAACDRALAIEAGDRNAIDLRERAQKHLDLQRRDAEREAAAKREAERKEAERLEQERQKAARLEAERREAERKEAERLERERQEAARLEAERREAERKEAERLEQERRARQQRIEAEVAAAGEQFASGEFAAGVSRLQALRKAEGDAPEIAEALRDGERRQEAARLEAERREAERKEAERLEQERRARQQRVEAGVAAAEEQFGRAEFGAGLSRLAALRKAEGDAPEIAQAVRDGERRQEAARREAERQEAERLEQERRARQERIEAGLAEAGEQFGRAEFGAGLSRLQALRKAEGDAPEIAQAIRDGERRQEAARIAKEIDGHLDRSREALAAERFDEADEAVRAALGLDRGHEAARQLSREIAQAVKAEKKRQKDAARQARQNEKRIAALLRKAGKAKGHETAIAALRELLTVEPDHAEAKALLATRESARDAALAEEKRRREEEETAPAAAVPDEPAVTGPPTAGVSVLTRALEIVRRFATEASVWFGRQAARTKAEGQKLTTRIQAWGVQQWGVAAGVVLVSAVLAYVAFGRGSEPLPTLADTGVGVSTRFVPPGDRVDLAGLGLGSSAVVSEPVETAPAPEPTPTPPPEIPPPEPEVAPPVGGAGGDPDPAVDPRVAQLTQRAFAEYARGDRDAALATAEQVLALDRFHEEIYDWLGPIQQDAFDKAVQARRDADAAGRLAQQTPEYFEAATLQAGASERSDARDFTNAIRDWWRAAELFAAAEVLARAAAAAIEIDMDAINAVIDQYRLALEALDVAGVQRVFPAVDVPALRAEFLAVTRQRIEISECRVIASTATNATVRCDYRNVAQSSETRREVETRGEIMLMMQHVDGRWIINGRR